MQYEKDTSQSRKTVCLIDDEVDITTVINRSLTQEGYIVHEFSDPIKAWEYFQKNGMNCTIVLLDVRKPSMNGF
jgi:DNA-binding response OmpR family regulator